jgi:hypothetical protein
MSYKKHTGALGALAERINKPAYSNVAFLQLQGLPTKLQNSIEALGVLHSTTNPTENSDQLRMRAARQLVPILSEFAPRTARGYPIG